MAAHIPNRAPDVIGSSRLAHVCRRLSLGLLAVASFGLLCTRRVRVSGNSMAPALQNGDRLLAVPAPHARPGSVVLLPDPRYPERVLVKRLVSSARDQAWVTGDNADESTDSRHFGPVRIRAPWWVAVWRYAPVDRMGAIRSTLPTP